jgi:hypothetical protein
VGPISTPKWVRFTRLSPIFVRGGVIVFCHYFLGH